MLKPALRAVQLALRDTFLPPVCLACRRLLRGPGPLCSTCDQELAPLPPEHRREGGIEALYAHDGPLRAAVAALKFSGQLELAGPLAGLMTAARTVATQRWDVLAPVPLHRWRAMRRGYNQSALLAFELAARLPDASGSGPLRVDPRLLRRVRATRPQRGLDGAARRHNVTKAFALSDPAAVVGRRVLLIDDVTTTGATLTSCMSVVEQGGASRVAGLALLRALS